MTVVALNGLSFDVFAVVVEGTVVSLYSPVVVN